MDPALLELSEAIEVGQAGPIRADGLVPLHVIRPGIGRGRGRHLYEADMLKEAVAQGRFKSWKMYVDHQSPEAKKAAGGLPRSVRDLGGIIKEAWWDPNVPADPARGWGPGAVVGLAKPTRLIASLIEDDPELVEASISATATGVRPVQRGRETVWLVEGIRPRGSVDWVTEAGAGGRVAPLIEALVESDDFEEELEMAQGAGTDVPTDDELVEWLLEERPDLLERALVEADAEDAGDGGKDEHAELTQKYLKKFNGNRALAARAAKRALKAQEAAGGDEVDATELLTEALDNDDFRDALDESVRESFARIVAPTLQELVEAALEDERELLRAEGKAEADRMMEVRDLRDVAHAMIAESRLPDVFQVELRERYDLVERQPTAALDVLAEEDDAGAITKSAEDVLREAVEADIARKRGQASALRPTRVRGQGEGKPVEESEEGAAAEKKPKPKDEAPTTGSYKTDAILNEAGVTIDDGLYEGILG